METYIENPYQKLAKTPLAQKHRMCGLEPGTMGIILGLISLIIDPLPSFLMAMYVLQMDLVVDDDDFFSSASESFRKQHRENMKQFKNTPRMICVVIGVLFAVIHFIGIIALIIGSVRNQTQLMHCWCCTMVCQGFMGRFMFSFFLFFLGVKFAPLFALLIIADIILGIAVMYCIGQMATVERNKRYLSASAMRYNIRPAGNPQTSQTLIPPTSYPH